MTSTGTTPGNESSSAVDTAKEAGSAAAEGAKHVASDAADQAKAVVASARDELHRFTGQARDELNTRTQEQTDRLAGGLHSFSHQLTALASGRRDEAGALPNYVDELDGKVRQLASRLEQGGAQGMLEDVTDFARRKPGLFLLGAVGAGFLVGRLVRSGAAERNDPEYHPQPEPRAYPQPVYAERAVARDPFDTPPVPPIDRPAGSP